MLQGVARWVGVPEADEAVAPAMSSESTLAGCISTPLTVLPAADVDLPAYPPARSSRCSASGMSGEESSWY